MIKGIGVDLVKIDRVINLSDYQIKRMFSPQEAEDALKLEGKSRGEFLASRFAAKEAFSKSLGTGISGFALADIEVKKDEKGAPFFIFSNKLDKIVSGKKFFLSLSHEEDVAIAMVVCDES